MNWRNAANRWTIGAAAWLAFALVVWFAGDAVGVGDLRPLDAPWQRIVCIALAGAAWLCWEWFRTRRAREAAGRMLDAIAQAGAEGDSAARAAEEIEILRARFVAAAAVLKQARFTGPGGETQRLHELPWYVFIGAPGSGKTTALVHSGLRFILGGASGAPAVQGVGGTRNCDWWFTDEAVLLDTAGRYTTQESDRKADAAAWYGFLDLLKQFRPRLPLNGAIVTVSVSDLLLWTREERLRYAGHVRMRLAELYARLGLRFPVYVMVTKADLLAGFMEFFGELDAEARARVWGVTFDPETVSGQTGAAGRFEAEFAALEERLHALLIERLHREPDLQRRAAIYRFPQQFHALGPLLSEFLVLAFAQQQNHEPPMLRGVYFTSGTQEGNPIDRVLGAIARTFDLERAPAHAASPSGKAFFIRRLLQEVIFPEQGLARPDKRRRAWRPLAYAAIAAASVALAAAWTASYFGNRGWIGDAGAAVREARVQLAAAARAVAPAPPLLRALDTLERLATTPVPLVQRVGLSQHEKVIAQARRAYRAALRDALTPLAAAALEKSVREAPGSATLEASLAAYLALCEARAGEAAQIASVLATYWGGDVAASLARHVRAGLAEGPPQRADEALVRQARERLAQGARS
ncbi:MAG: type VI secretion system membrane subunit TssM [Burkholderiales bacterium]|nr:type VI secretion system membrane subunit TssM [Burkholderiales bacterium]